MKCGTVSGDINPDFIPTGDINATSWNTNMRFALITPKMLGRFSAYDFTSLDNYAFAI
jgi:hypothetical protein